MGNKTAKLRERRKTILSLNEEGQVGHQNDEGNVEKREKKKEHRPRTGLRRLGRELLGNKTVEGENS